MLMFWNLRALMAARRVTSKKLADAVGRSESGVDKWRGSDVPPALDGTMYGAICEALECRLDELLYLK